MVDGAIYAIKRDFLYNACTQPDVNAAFWAGRFCAVENKVGFFVDVDEPEDMERFLVLSGLV